MKKNEKNEKMKKRREKKEEEKKKPVDSESFWQMFIDSPISSETKRMRERLLEQSCISSQTETHSSMQPDSAP